MSSTSWMSHLSAQWLGETMETAFITTEALTECRGPGGADVHCVKGPGLARFPSLTLEVGEAQWPESFLLRRDFLEAQCRLRGRSSADGACVPGNTCTRSTMVPSTNASRPSTTLKTYCAILTKTNQTCRLRFASQGLISMTRFWQSIPADPAGHAPKRDDGRPSVGQKGKSQLAEGALELVPLRVD